MGLDDARESLGSLLSASAQWQVGRRAADPCRALWSGVLWQVIEDAAADWDGPSRQGPAQKPGESPAAYAERLAERQRRYLSFRDQRRREIRAALRWLFEDNRDAEWVAEQLDIDLPRLRRALLVPPGEWRVSPSIEGLLNKRRLARLQENLQRVRDGAALAPVLEAAA